MSWIMAHLPLLALIGFFSGWVGIAIWLYLPKNATKIERNRYIPLEEFPDGRTK